MEYAKSLVKKRPEHGADGSGAEDNLEDDSSDSWTIVGDVEVDSFQRYNPSHGS